MNKWVEWIAIAVVAVMLVAACLGIYAEWSHCVDSGGVVVRGMFGLECLKK